MILVQIVLKEERLSHLFKDCTAIQCIWNSFTIPGYVRITFNMDWGGWLMAHLHCSANCELGFHWNTLKTLVYHMFLILANSLLIHSSLMLLMNGSMLRPYGELPRTYYA
ncbi:hypothetical protein RchiOBHm_Chr6g0253621 [Rosa chinensis]|uniref:Uncharacterized protein n=1 Tax=Rosa chinensis TaxID=74649 RepID=A0A2P6PLD3_ROSCH|nr:hypothetical protein RchiOBHm_Chr6g0253621 [Rosa chinensis]